MSGSIRDVRTRRCWPQRPQLSWPADLYIEGVDQHRGWFQVSLITATATRDAAPYRTVLTNGLTLDELGRKMSKSLGNVENAADVVSRVGADVMRLVFASVDYAADMRVGEDLFSAVSESYRKLRNTSRYMLGNLYDFDPRNDLVETARMLEFDRFALLRLERLKQAALRGLPALRFPGRLQRAGQLRGHRPEFALRRGGARSPLLLARRLARAALRANRDVSHSGRDGPHPRAVAALYRRRDLLSHPGRPRAKRASAGIAAAAAGLGRRRTRRTLEASAQRSAERRLSCSRRCARREQSEPRWRQKFSWARLLEATADSPRRSTVTAACSRTCFWFPAWK